MRVILLSVFAITMLGCSTEQFNEGMAGFAAGAQAGHNQQVQQQQDRKSKIHKTDQTCFQDCQSRYSYDFCKNKCSY